MSFLSFILEYLKKKGIIKIPFLFGIFFLFLIFVSCTSVEKDIPFKERLTLFNQALMDADSGERKKESKRVLTLMKLFHSEFKGKSMESLDDQERDRVFFKKILLKLERNLKSKEEKRQYYSYKAYLSNDESRIEFLLIPSVGKREVWFKQKKSVGFDLEKRKLFRNLIEKQDVAIGMNQEEVFASLGKPYRIEVAGQRMYRNEIWYYLDVVSEVVSQPIDWKEMEVLEEHGKKSLDTHHHRMNRIYFEEGMVVGWDRRLMEKF